MAASVRWRRAEAMARPCLGRCHRRARPQPHKAGGAGCGPGAPGAWRPPSRTRHVEEIHEAAVLAPSAAQCSPASKAAVASVMKDAKRASSDAALHGVAVAVVLGSRGDQCLECVAEVLQLHGLMQARGCHTSRTAQFLREMPHDTFAVTGRPFYRGTVVPVGCGAVLCGATTVPVLATARKVSPAQPSAARHGPGSN